MNPNLGLTIAHYLGYGTAIFAALVAARSFLK
jgi:hypothetical protein